MIALRALAALLGYPHPELRAALPEIAEALRTAPRIPPMDRAALMALIEEIASGDQLDAEARYVELFDPGDFAAQARELSNCPSGVFGGNLGQIGRGESVPEFEVAVFANGSIGILPHLVKTRYGFHVVAVDHRVPGEAVPFAAVRERIADQLAAGVQQRALMQYVALLAGEAEISGVDLAQASSPLVQ